MKNLAEGCAARGHDVTVLRFCLTSQDAPREETLNGVRIVYQKLPNLYALEDPNPAKWKKALWHLFDLWNPLAAWRFYKVLKAERPDIINSSVIAGFSTSIHSVAKWMSVPVVHTMRDYYLICQQNAMFRGGENCKQLCAGCKPFAVARKFTSKHLSRVLANSEYVLRAHKTHNAFPQTIPHFTQFNMNKSEHIETARSFPKSRPATVGFIGRLDVTKGIEILLQAFKQIEKGAVLKIAGKGTPEYEAKLKDLSKGYNVEFVGYVDADKFYSEIDILVCPSVYNEPLPRVVYEAYAYALPVIVSDTGGTPEIVDHGQTGFIYPAQDVEALASHIKTLLVDSKLYEALSTGAAEKAKEFRPSVILDQFIGHLEGAVEGSAA